MPKYDVTAPDGRVYEVNAPDGATQDEAIQYVQQNLYKPTAKAAAPEEKGGFLQGAKNLAAGGLRGAGSIGATLLAPVDVIGDALAGKGLSLESNRQRRKDMDSALETMGAQPDSWLYQGGKLAGEIAGTAGAGGVLGNVAARAGASAPLVQAVTSSGFTAGGKTGLAGVATRAAGGALSGGATALAVNPDDALTGALIGGALPGGVQLLGKAGQVAGGVVRDMRTPTSTKVANKLAKAMDLTPQQLAQALNQQGPEMIPGYRRTVPQILENKVASQLQRTLKTAGANAIGDAEQAQQAGFRAALERVAPMGATVQDAAERAGGAIDAFGKSERAAITKQISRAFDGVDPFGESAIYLPIEQMQGAAGKYLGDGTFDTGERAFKAIKKAQDVGTMVLPAVKPTTAKAAGKAQSLEQAVRAAGGIKPGAGGLSGEIGDLMNRQSGTSGLVNKKSGKPVDLLAGDMFRRGFIPDDDPATLLEVLRGGGGRKVYASDVTDNAFARQFEGAMGDAPGAEVIPKAVPFNTVKNLRSSIGTAAEKAALAQDRQEAAALRQMVSAIDDKLKSVSDGGGVAGEYFAPDMVTQYRDAMKMHADKMKRFEMGPQIGMFRKAGDGQAQIQGAEIPGKFFSGRRSQVEDVQAFKRLIGNRDDLADELKRFAVTEGYGTSNTAGDLTSKYVKWLESRSGATRELFSKQELATLKEVGKAVERQINAEQLGRVSGSDTAQKLASLSQNGLLDSRAVDVLANRIPIIGQFTGPMLSGLRKTATETQNNQMASLLADPEALAAALRKGTPQDIGLLNLLSQGGRGLLKVAPVISAQ